MKILESSAGLNERQTFQITKGDSLGRLRDNVGRRFDIMEYVLYEDTNRDGVDQTLLAVVTSDGDIIATNSATAIRMFLDMKESFALPITDVEVTSGTTKAGRMYCNFRLV